MRQLSQVISALFVSLASLPAFAVDRRCPVAEPVYGLIVDNGPTQNVSSKTPFRPTQNTAHLNVSDLIAELRKGDVEIRVPGVFAGKNLLVMENIDLTTVPAGRHLMISSTLGDVLLNGEIIMKDKGSTSADQLTLSAKNIDQIDCTDTDPKNQTNNRPLIRFGLVELRAKLNIGKYSTQNQLQIEQTDLGRIAATSGGNMSLETWAPTYHQFGVVGSGNGISAGGNLSLLLRKGKATNGPIHCKGLVYFNYGGQ